MSATRRRRPVGGKRAATRALKAELYQELARQAASFRYTPVPQGLALKHGLNLNDLSNLADRMCTELMDRARAYGLDADLDDQET